MCLDGVAFEIRSGTRLRIAKSTSCLIGLIAPRPIALITSMDRARPPQCRAIQCIQLSLYRPADRRCRRCQPPRSRFCAEGHGAQYPSHRRVRGQHRHRRHCGEDEHLRDRFSSGGTNELEIAGFTTTPSQIVRTPRIAEAHAALECREHTTLEIGRSRIILGRVVAIYVEDRYVDPAGPYIKAEELHAMGRMNGLGNYVRTRDAFLKIPRLSYEDWKKRQG